MIDLVNRRRVSGGRFDMTALLVAILFVILFAFLGYLVSVYSAFLSVIGLSVFLFCLRSPSLAILLLILSMLLSPEIQVKDGIRLRGEELVVPLLAVALLAKTVIPRFRARLRTSPLDVVILALLLINVAASIRGGMIGSVDPLESLFANLKILEFFLIYWLTFNYIRDTQRIKTLLLAGLGVLVFITVYSYLQIPGTEVHTTNRLTAPFEGSPEPTTLGGYFTLVLGILISMAIYDPGTEARRAWWILSGVVLVPILFTLSRTTYVSCAGMILLLALITRHRGLLFGVSLGAVSAPLFLPHKIIERIQMTFRGSGGYAFDSSFMERIMVWKKAGFALEHSPLLGFGVPQGILDSQFARIILESGVLGLVAWICVLVTCLLLAFRTHRNAKNYFHKAIACGYAVGVIAMFIHALASITFYITRIAEPFWFLTGIVASLDRYYLEQNSKSD